ncbi:MAG: ATP-grasp domain-containing protein [Treponema sp.]|nr:ATP-grasp domain-containing protein [Treponema sp.]
MKKIMILGAGLMQKPAILAAKHLGFESVVVDANPNAVSVPLADAFYPIDLKDKDALLALAENLSKDEENGLSGVFTAGTDFSANVAYVANHFGFPCHDYEACLNASDKVRMRGCFSRAGVPSPAFQEIEKSHVEQLCEKAGKGEVEFPKVVKPCDNMGGRGCRLVRSKEELLPAVSASVRNSRTARAIFEDYMEGREFSIDSIVYKGTLTITGFADRHIFYPPYFIEMGHSLPSLADSVVKNQLIATFALGIKALGLTCGVAKADIKYTKNGPMIGEIAARLSGGYMSGWTFPYSSGMNLTEEAMKIAVGKEPDFILANRKSVPWQPHESVRGQEQPFELYEIKSNLVSAERAWLSIPGKVAAVYGLDEVREIYGVKDVLPRVKVGDKVDFPRNNVEKCGNIISVAISSEKAYRSAHEAVSSITLRLEPNNPDTDKFLRGEIDVDESGFPPSAFVLSSSQNEISIGENTVIPADKSVLSCIPETLEPFVDSIEDWNHCTLRKTLEKFDKICPTHKELDGKKFWHNVLRGGIQGILYLVDSN